MEDNGPLSDLSCKQRLTVGHGCCGGQGPSHQIPLQQSTGNSELSVRWVATLSSNAEVVIWMKVARALDDGCSITDLHSSALSSAVCPLALI